MYRDLFHTRPFIHLAFLLFKLIKKFLCLCGAYRSPVDSSSSSSSTLTHSHARTTHQSSRTHISSAHNIYNRDYFQSALLRMIHRLIWPLTPSPTQMRRRRPASIVSKTKQHRELSHTHSAHTTVAQSERGARERGNRKRSIVHLCVSSAFALIPSSLGA